MGPAARGNGWNPQPAWTRECNVNFDFWKRRDQDLEDELQAHLRMAAQDRRERGEPAGEAEDAARRELGNALLIKEVTRSIWGWAWLERVIQDLRFTCRTLTKDLGFTPVPVLPLPLPVPPNTPIFTLFN